VWRVQDRDYRRKTKPETSILGTESPSSFHAKRVIVAAAIARTMLYVANIRAQFPERCLPSAAYFSPTSPPSRLPLRNSFSLPTITESSMKARNTRPRNGKGYIPGSGDNPG